MVPTTFIEFLTAAVVLPVAALSTFTRLRTTRTVRIMLENPLTDRLFTLLPVRPIPPVLRTRCLTLDPALLQLSPKPLSTVQPLCVRDRQARRTDLTLAFTPPVPLDTLITVAPLSLVVPVALFLSESTSEVEKSAIRATHLPVSMLVPPHVLVVHPRMALEVLPNSALMLLMVRLQAVHVLRVSPLTLVSFVMVVLMLVSLIAVMSPNVFMVPLDTESTVPYVMLVLSPSPEFTVDVISLVVLGTRDSMLLIVLLMPLRQLLTVPSMPPKGVGTSVVTVESTVENPVDNGVASCAVADRTVVLVVSTLLWVPAVTLENVSAVIDPICLNVLEIGRTTAVLRPPNVDLSELSSEVRPLRVLPSVPRVLPKWPLVRAVWLATADSPSCVRLSSTAVVLVRASFLLRPVMVPVMSLLVVCIRPVVVPRRSTDRWHVVADPVMLCLQDPSMLVLNVPVDRPNLPPNVCLNSLLSPLLPTSELKAPDVVPLSVLILPPIASWKFPTDGNMSTRVELSLSLNVTWYSYHLAPT